ELLRDRAKTVVAREASTAPRLQAPEVEVAFVVHDEDRVRLDLEVARSGLHGAPGVVHVGLRLQERDLVPVDANLGELPVELALPRAVVAARKLVDDQPADVVTVPCIFAAGVAETDDEQIERCSVPARPKPHCALRLFGAFG